MKSGWSSRAVLGACALLGAAGVCASHGTSHVARHADSDNAPRIVEASAPATLAQRFGKGHDTCQYGVGVCYAPGTPLEVIQRVEEAVMAAYLSQFEGLEQPEYNTTSRWTGTQGDPFTVTWSFVPDGLSISNGIGEGIAPSTLFAEWDAVLPRASWIALFEQSFNRWSQLSGLNYQRVTAAGVDWDDGAAWGSGVGATRGHVRICMKPIDGLSGVLAYNQFPQNGDMVLDAGDLAPGGSNFGSSSNSYRFFRNTVMHEHGHGMGLLHVCSNNTSQLMEPFLSTSFDGPRQDDVRGAQRHYGDINEPDNTAATAVNAGAITVGSNVTLGNPPLPTTGTNEASVTTLSIDANGEQDYHLFSTASIMLANFTVTPFGTTYDEGSQAGDGSCPAGVALNALNRANLSLDLVASNGTTVLQTAAAQAAGVAETITGALLSPPGNFYLRVYEADAPTESQLYKLNLVGSSTPTMSASDGTSTTSVTITCTNIPGSVNYQVLRNTVNNKATAVVSASSATNTIVDATVTPGVTYFYWVQAIQGGGGFRDVAGPDTGFASVPTPPGAFSLTAPADGSAAVALTPTLSWTASAGVSTYTVIIDDNSDLSSPISTVPGIVGTNYNVPGGVLANCNTYFWGVRAVNGGGTTNSTPVAFSFETKRPSDINNDGFVDAIDYDLFISAWLASDISADFNADEFVDAIDYDLFINAWLSNC